MKNYSLLVAMCFISLAAFAQTVNMELLENMKPRAIGPAGMSGRVTSIDVVTEEPDIIYAGTASGGLWKSESGGVDWKPIFDHEAVASIGAVAIQQSNPDVVWVGTGEGNPRNSVTGGYGLYKSLDGGKSWKLMGLENTRNIHRIIIDPTQPDVVYVAAIGSSWGEHPERGVYKTTDGGKTWNKILFRNNRTGAADMIMDPSNPNKLIVSMWEHRRKPWTFSSGGPGSGIFLTVDGGDNWKELGKDEGLPGGELGRTGLAIATNKPNIIYALVESKKNALYKSEDGGYSWKKINDGGDIGNRPFYYSDIFVDPSNENRIYSLFSLVNISEDGGKSFRTLLPYSGIHPDHHAWYIHPKNPDFMIDGNDGGLNITRDGGKTWRFIENIPVAQFYHISVDNEYPYNVYGGMQDNGSWVGPAYALQYSGIRNSDWQEVNFGDGFDVLPDPDDSRYGYAMSQQGNVARYDRLTGRSNRVKPTHTDPDIRLRFNWNSPIAQDPYDNATIYFGSQFVHKSTDKGKTWEVISPDLTTNDPAKQKQGDSGGLTIDATGAENFTTVISIEPSSVEKGVIWAGTDDGRLHVTRNGGETWTEVSSSISGMPKGAWIPQIRASQFDAGEAYVIVNNYRLFDFKPYLFRTRDYGKTWENLVDNNKVWGYTLSVIQDPIEKNLLFLGTEYGLYVSIDEGRNWTKWHKGYPTVSTIDLAIQPREHDLVIGTFGRAAYVLDDIRPLREMAKTSGKALNEKVKVYNPPTAIINETRRPDGPRFPGDSFFEGENRRGGAMITYSLFHGQKDTKPETNSKSRKKKKGSEPATIVEAPKRPDSVSVYITNMNGEEIRKIQFKSPEKDGIHRLYWQLDERGIERPSRRNRNNRRFEPGGVQVMPGQYKVRVEWGDASSETTIEVKYDPRVDVTTEELQAKYDMLKEMEAYGAVVVEATKRMTKSLGIVSEYEKQLKSKKGEDYKALKEKNKEVKETLNGFMDRILGSQDERQGLTRSNEPTVMRYFGQASGYINSVEGVPGATEERLMKFAVDAFNEIIGEINDFYANDWATYRDMIEEADLSPFTELQPLEMENK